MRQATRLTENRTTGKASGTCIEITLERCPKVLTITSEFPWPLDTGGRIRSFHLQKSLASACDMTLVAPVTKQQEATLAEFPPCGLRLATVTVPNRSKLPEFFRAAYADLLRQPYVMYRRHARQPVFRAVANAIQSLQPDVVYLDHLDSLVFRPLFPDLPIVLDLHNIYSLIADRYAREHARLFARWYLRRQAKLLAVQERRGVRTADLVLSVSPHETTYFQSLGARQVKMIPNGVDCSRYEDLPIGRDQSPCKLLFLGTLNWGPNANGASFLIHHVFPAIRRKIPDAQLWIVGHQPPVEVAKWNGRDGITVTGSVPEVKPFLRDASLMLVPLDSGGGTRLKILEAFAAGLPVISTAIGAEGLSVRNDEHLLLRERNQFIEGILSLRENPEFALNMAQRARSLAQKQYDWRSVGADAVSAVLSLARGAARA